MTETVQLTPEQLTGAYVRQLREFYHLSRQALAERAGFKTATRLVNIETKDSWKASDREALVRTFNDLAVNPPTTKIGRRKGETGDERAARLQSALQTNGKAITAADTEATTPNQVAVESAFFDESLEELSLVTQVADGLPVPVTATSSDGVFTITNSEVAVWQRCRRRWWLAFYRRLALAAQDYTGPRAIGNRVHRALAAWYVPDGTERVDPRDALERVIVEDWTAIAAQVQATAANVEDELAMLNVKFNDAVSLERAMVEGYLQWLEETGADANLVVTAPETVLSADLTGAVAGDDVAVRVMAKLDVRAQRTSDGAHVFLDHKTVGNFTDPRKTLHLDPQMLEYHLLEWLNSEAAEKICDAALYNMLRKVKRSANAKPPFYDRVEVHHNVLELENYRLRLLGVARDVQRATRELAAGADPMSVVYPNPTRNCSWDCDFYPVCPMFDDGSRVEDALAALYVETDPLARYHEEIV